MFVGKAAHILTQPRFSDELFRAAAGCISPVDGLQIYSAF
jgi:hypothetical protein